MPGVGRSNCTSFELDTSTGEKVKTKRKRLYYSALTASLAFFSCGASLSWTSPTLPKLQSSDSWLAGVDDEVSSLIASFLMLGASVGPIIAGLLLNNLGRKKTLILSTALHLASWIFLGFAATAELIYLARFLQGLVVAIVFCAVPMYVAEIAERTMRAALASSSETFLALGYVMSYSVGPFVSYTMLIVISSIIPFVTFVLFFLIPESPHFMLAKGNKNKAMQDLRWLRGNVSVTAAKREIAMIQASLEQGLAHTGKKSKFYELIGNPGCVKALYLSCGLMLLQQFSGINVVLFYAQTIFIKSGASFSPSASAMIVGAVQLVSALITPALVKKFGFKGPLCFSAAGMCCAQGALGLYFFCEESGYDMSPFWWVPVASLVMYINVYCLGFGPLPWAFLGEIFPPNIKEFAAGFCTSFSFFLAFLITKFFVNISGILGTYAAFWIFSSFCVIALLFVIFLMPNTRGLSLPEIQDLLNGRLPASRLDKIPEEVPVKNATATNNLI